MSTPAEDPAPAEVPAPEALAAEDKKLVTLARSTRARTRAAEGAAVRDADGRTYAAATVDLPSLQVSALGVCVAMAVASGATGLEAAVVLTDAAAVTPRGQASRAVVPTIVACKNLSMEHIARRYLDRRASRR